MNKLIRLAALLAFLPATAAAQDAEWLVAPYGWLSDVTFGQSSESISGSDLLRKSDAAGMIRVEAAKNRWGISVDYLWLAISDERTFALPDPLPSPVTVRGEIDLGVLELAGVYRPSGEAEGVNLLFGMRRINVDTTLLLIPPAPMPAERFDDDTSATDVMLGARYLHRFGERWDMALRGDYSFGDSEGSLNLMASAGFRFNDTFATQLGYRYFELEYKDSSSDSGDSTEIELSGPFLGLVFRF